MVGLGLSLQLHLETVVYGRMTATRFVNSRENSYRQLHWKYKYDFQSSDSRLILKSRNLNKLFLFKRREKKFSVQSIIISYFLIISTMML